MAGIPERRFAEWTTGERRRLLEMRAKGMTAPEIAKQLGRSADAIYSFLRYVPVRARGKPVPPKPYTPSDQLRDAILRALLSHAERAHVDIDTAARKLLSGGETVA